jgi:hypothetical protein
MGGGDQIRRALDGAAEFFAPRETRAGVLARRLAARSRPDDPALTEHLVRELRRRSRIDGSIGGSLVATAWAAWELMDLGCETDCAGLVRMIGYVLAQQDRPGHFREGCTPERHAARECHHFLTGFFSPGGQDFDIAPLTLPTGASFRREDEARLAASCFALRSVLRAGEDRREAVKRHVAALLDSPLAADPWSTDRNPDLFFLVLGAAGHGPIETRASLGPLLDRVVKAQQDDGTWIGTDTFHALGTLARLPDRRVRDVATRVAPHLCARQQPSGAFDPGDDEEWALIATRTLLLAAGTPGG